MVFFAIFLLFDVVLFIFFNVVKMCNVLIIILNSSYVIYMYEISALFIFFMQYSIISSVNSPKAVFPVN